MEKNPEAVVVERLIAFDVHNNCSKDLRLYIEETEVNLEYVGNMWPVVRFDHHPLINQWPKFQCGHGVPHLQVLKLRF